MSKSEQETIVLVTHWHYHESPDEYHAFKSRESANEWLNGRGLEPEDFEEYTAPGGPHEAADDPNQDRYSYSIRELVLEDG